MPGLQQKIFVRTLASGAAGAVAYWVMIQLLPADAAVVFAMTAMVLTTGAMGERALGRVVEMFAERESKEIGTIVIVLALLLRFALLRYLPPSDCWRAMVVGGVGAGWMMIGLRQLTGGEGKLTQERFAMATGTAAGVTFLLGIWGAIGVCGLSGCVVFVIWRMANRRGRRVADELLYGMAVIGELAIYLGAVLFV